MVIVLYSTRGERREDNIVTRGFVLVSTVIVIKGYWGWHRRLRVIGRAPLFTIWIMIRWRLRSPPAPAATFDKLLSLITPLCSAVITASLFKGEYGFVILPPAKWKWQYFMSWHLIYKSGRGCICISWHRLPPRPSSSSSSSSWRVEVTFVDRVGPGTRGTTCCWMCELTSANVNTGAKL